MSEKRFTYENNKVYDNLTGEFHSSNMVSVNVLNELAEENEQLQKENNILNKNEDDLEECTLENIKLKEENEQLRQRIAFFKQQADEFEQYTAQTIQNMIANYRDGEL